MNYLNREKILGEDFSMRLKRFEWLSESAPRHHVLSDRDVMAIKTVYHLLVRLKGIVKSPDGESGPMIVREGVEVTCDDM